MRLRCPHCASADGSSVLETRHNAIGLFRRRRCDLCFDVFITEEHVSTRSSIPQGSGAAKRRIRRNRELERAHAAGQETAQAQEIAAARATVELASILGAWRPAVPAQTE